MSHLSRSFPAAVRSLVGRLGVAASLATLLAACAQTSHHAQGPAPVSPAEQAFERLASLEGEWVDVDGSYSAKDEVAVTYRVTGGGSAVLETLFPGTPHEMVTVYHRDGDDLVLTHYCSAGNQPRMRAVSMTDDRIVFDYDGGSNIDPARDDHMHSGQLEFLSPDEIRGEWTGWVAGKPDPAHRALFHLVRAQS